MLECNTCKGRYAPLLPDGTRYFHACPPLTRVAVTRADEPIVVDLSAVLPTDRVTVLRAGVLVTVPVVALQAGDERQGDIQVERPDKRDENIVNRPDDRRHGKPKLEGNGTREL